MLNNGSLFAADLIPVHTINSEWCQWRNAITAHPILGEKIDGESTAEKIIKAVDQFKVSLQGEKPMSIRLSGGKDSTTVVVFVYACDYGTERVRCVYCTSASNSVF